MIHGIFGNMPGNKSVVAIIATVLLVTAVIVLSIRFSGFQRTVHIHNGGESLTYIGDAELVSEVLDAAGISPNMADLVYPPLTTEIEAGSIISITKANKIELIVDGAESEQWTHQDILINFLAEQNLNWMPTTRIYADNRLVEPDTLATQNLPVTLSLVNQKSVSISDGPELMTYETYADTVGETLWENDIEVSYSDKISPSIGTWLLPDQHINIKRANNYQIDVDGHEIRYSTHYTKVRDVLVESGLILSGADYSVPSSDSDIDSGDKIRIIRVRHEYNASDVPIPYSSSLVPVQDLEIDQRTQVSAGLPGARRELSRVRIENGIPVSESPVGGWRLRAPANESIGYGAKIVLRSLNTPDGTVEYWRVVTMRATAYTAATSGKAPDHPAYGITASGVPAGTGVVAIDPNIVPFRSSLYIPGYGIAFAGDTGGAVKGRIIDLGYDEGELVSWSGFVEVYYLTPVPPSDQINYLLP